MLKSSIIDISVRIIPSEQLVTYLKDHIREGGLLPENIQKILNKTSKKDVLIETEIKPVKLEKAEVEALQQLNQVPNEPKSDDESERPDETSAVEDVSEEGKQVKDVLIEPEITEKQTPDTRQSLSTPDLRWIFNFLQDRRKTDSDTPYLNELLQGSKMILPENHYVERNPVLEERCKRLRKEQEQREYNKMTKNVDNVRKRDPEDTIGYQMRAINSQLIAILQFVFSVAAGFAFGFVGIALIVGDMDFGFRLLLGIMFALIIALAEIYFLAKKLNEDYETKPEGPIYNDYGTQMDPKAKKDN